MSPCCSDPDNGHDRHFTPVASSPFRVSGSLWPLRPDYRGCQAMILNSFNHILLLLQARGLFGTPDDSTEPSPESCVLKADIHTVARGRNGRLGEPFGELKTCPCRTLIRCRACLVDDFRVDRDAGHGCNEPRRRELNLRPFFTSMPIGADPSVCAEGFFHSRNAVSMPSASRSSEFDGVKNGQAERNLFLVDWASRRRQVPSGDSTDFTKISRGGSCAVLARFSRGSRPSFTLDRTPAGHLRIDLCLAVGAQGDDP